MPVLRCVGERNTQVKEFEVFGPKALAGIGALPDTVADRSLPIRLKRRAPSERVERFRTRDAESEAKELCARGEEFAAAHLEGLPPQQAIKKLIESSFDHLDAHPDFIVLLNDENRGGARHVRGSRKLEAMHSPLVSMVSKILKEGVRAGTFRKGINPVQLYISIAALGYFYFSNTPTLSAIFGKDLSKVAARRGRRKHVVDLVMQALRQ